MRLIIIGGGNMGGAILLALVKAEVIPPKNILLIEPDDAKRQNLSKATCCESQAEFNENVRNYDLLILAVKPQGATPAMELLAQWLLPHQLVISVMAGISLQTMHAGPGTIKTGACNAKYPYFDCRGYECLFCFKEC